MSVNAVGTIRKVTLNGITFTVAADSDFSQIRGRFTSEGIATSGANMKKVTARVEEVTGVELITNGAEFEKLKELSESTKDFPISYTTAAGDVYHAPGWIDLEKRQTADGKTSVKLIPRLSWEPFLA